MIKCWSWENPNPYTIMFVYCQDGDKFVLKGGLRNIEIYLKTFKKSCIIFQTMFHKKSTRTTIECLNTPFTVYFSKKHKNIKNRYGYNNPYGKTNKQTMAIFKKVRSNEQSVILFKKDVRQIPRCWPIEFNQFMNI